MLSFIFLLFAVIHLGLLAWGWRAWTPAGRPVALTVLLIGNTLLWYDNFRIGMGRFIGEGDLLYNMSVPAFVWHWTMLPLLVIVAGSIARLAGLAWARNRMVMGAFCVVAVGLIVHDLPYALGLLSGGAGSLPAVELRPACIADTLRYSTRVSPAQFCSPDTTAFANGPSSLPAIAMNVIMVAVGIALWVRHGWKWLVILPGLMFVAAGSGRLWGPYALPVANFGEILFTTGVLLTILHFSPGRRTAELRTGDYAPSAGRSPAA
jgi:hypothetical protein